MLEVPRLIHRDELAARCLPTKLRVAAYLEVIGVVSLPERISLEGPGCVQR